MAFAAPTSSVLRSAREIAADIKLHHSVFALPFAVHGAFMAAASVSEVPSALPDGFCVKRTRPSRFAVFEHLGSVRTHRETILHAFLDWLPDSRFEYFAEGVQISRLPSPERKGEFWLPIEG